MPKPFVKLTVPEFEDLVATFDFTRSISEVHMHHTWRPNHAQYRGLPTINSMWEFHTQTNGWSDIAQHISIAPDGSIWTGRNWNRPPASAVGFNGNSDKGPFMFEMIGDFDTGKDPFADPQKAAVIRVITALLKRFSLPVTALRFHNQMTNQKSCPGTAIDQAAFSKEVQAALQGSPASARKRGDSSSVVQEIRLAMSGPVQVDLAAPEFRSDHLHFPESAFASRGPATAGAPVNAAAHLINLRDGRLSNSGGMTTSPAALEALFQVHLPDALANAKAAGHPLRIMFFAHGGLNNEQGAVAAALSRVPWWQSNDIYPIFFIWETGLLETWGQMLERKVKEMWGGIGGIFGRRGFWDFVADHATDPAVERLARSIGGVGTWGAMKNSARRASEEGSGGAWLAAKHLKDFLKNTKGHPVELHGIGHSAGSIFHAHFLSALRGMLGSAGPTVKTLHHLAPAIRVDLFKEKVLPLLGKGIDRLTMYTMTDAREREDTCMKVYKKSLLYLIHHGLEPENRCPLVGLQQSVLADPTLRNLFEPAAPGVAEVIWSPSQGGPRHSSNSREHGGFDDDDDTMNSVCRRILGRDDITEYNVKSRSTVRIIGEEATDEQIALGILTDFALRKFSPATATATSTTPSREEAPDKPASPVEAPAVNVRPPAGRKRAVCIGINDYPDASDRLNGCVSDAQNWADFLSSEGFKTDLLKDDAASHESILAAVRDLVSSARAGDIIALQYSGHGVQVDDLDDDEGDDLLDEALCCHDFRTGRLVLDDDLKSIIAGLAKGVNLSLIIDSCHSGTVNKAVNLSRPATIAPPGSARRQAYAGAALNQANAAFRGDQPAADKAGRKRRRTSQDPYENAVDVLFAAALPSQFAHEIRGAGVFTNTAMEILRGPRIRMTNAKFMKAIGEAFPSEFRAIQQPTLYSSKSMASKPFLGLA